MTLTTELLILSSFILYCEGEADLFQGVDRKSAPTARGFIAKGSATYQVYSQNNDLPHLHLYGIKQKVCCYAKTT